MPMDPNSCQPELTSGNSEHARDSESVPRPWIGEVVSIGDEMTSGARVDTNAAWLSRRLGELGVAVEFHSTVGDSLEHNVDVFRIASQRADVVVATGGLGPTRDDLTREALARLVDQPLQQHDASLAHIESLFARRQREMPVRNRVQAMFPVGSVPIFNPQGTAPGIEIDVLRHPESGTRADATSRIFALPGVPAEMKRMFDESVAPRVLEMVGGDRVIRHHVMKFFGTGESDMEHRLGEMIARDRQPRVGITVSKATISLRITATGQSERECISMIEPTRQEILQRAGEFYFGDGEHFEQHHAIDAILRERQQSLAVVEFGFAAPLGDWFASLGETPAFGGGLSLATSKDLQQLYGGEDASQSTDAFRRAMHADWTLVVDGYPPLQDQADRPQPPSRVDLAVVSPDGRWHPQTVSLGGHPDILHARIAKTAQALLRRTLDEIPQSHR